MNDIPQQKLVFIFCTIAGIGLLGAYYHFSVSTAGFLLILFSVCMALARWRIPKLYWTSVIDVLLFVILSPAALGVALFHAMYHGMYFVILAAAYVFFAVDIYAGLPAVLGGLLGLFLRLWDKERDLKLAVRDEEAGKYYELESLQTDLSSALAQIERMAAISERARISRDIHDNAGHEIVAAYISLQTARNMMDGADEDALALYDAALERLGNGADKIREAVHNMSTVTFLGVDNLRDICERFPACPVDFNVFGDTTKVPLYIWTMFESCLNESLTNASRHSKATKIKVDLDVAPHIVRLSIENDGVSGLKGQAHQPGNGLRNLRHRASAVGGSLSIDSGSVFRVICVIPIKGDNYETTYS